MARYKKRRYALYRQLIGEGLLPIEAHEFSKMRKHVPPGNPFARPQYPPALKRIVQGRRELREGFRELAKSMGWGKTRRKAEYYKFIYGEYASLSKRFTSNFFVSKDVHGRPIRRRINPWALYDSVYDELPAEMQWDTPRQARTRRKTTETLVKFSAARQYRLQRLRDDIKFLEKEIRLHGDPHGATEFRLSGLRYQLRTGDY